MGEISYEKALKTAFSGLLEISDNLDIFQELRKPLAFKEKRYKKFGDQRPAVRC